MSEYELKNAKIKSTSLGIEDHGIFSSYLYFDYGGSGQGFGGYGLDDPLKDKSGKFTKRIGTAYGCEYIKRILETLEIMTWEELPNTYCRVYANHSKIEKIGHILKDQWFDPKKLAEEMEIE